MQQKRPTLQDIADKIGITKMTVSRYLRDPNSVAAKTRSKIALVIEEIGYIENKAPAMLSKASSRAIGILVPSLSNQVFAKFIKGIEKVTKENGYETLIAHFGYDEKEEEAKVASLLSYHVDGLILTESTHTVRTLQMIKTTGVPVIEAMELPEKPIDMAVGLDHEAAAYFATQSILDSGKLNVAYFGARLDTRTQLRMAGYDRAMNERGARPIHILTEAHSSFTLGGELLDKALNEYPSIDGVLCTNDDIAVGVTIAAQQRGIRIPEQLGIVGYNALNIGKAISPQLNSIDIPIYKIGEKSAELLLEVLRGEEVQQKIYDLGFSMREGQSLQQ
ncbi:substrate-binding domain-containing protein [Vibrio sp. TH_r3]|uniref:substrate-binding domain-containing protein n=1 Tax=Vibrio sp. TH_r3 TaxID=3082084 RepID=UPI0029530D7E|nr:substrate-binding domain-containing protein [Vibrio sp. TH_r3]MDV7105370.1 substrate-binding domain-containing protein [Vibrio sp. TH_r3]